MIKYILVFLLISTSVNARNIIAQKCFSEYKKLTDIAYCIDSTRNENIRKANAEQWEFLKKNPRYRFPGQSLNECFGKERELLVDRVETTTDKVVVYYKKSVKPCIK